MLCHIDINDVTKLHVETHEPLYMYLLKVRNSVRPTFLLILLFVVLINSVYRII